MATAQLPLDLEVSRPALDLAGLCADEERAVARELRWGRAAARQVGEIAAAAELPERRVQELISHLLLDHQWPVGTSMAAPFGNYLIDDRDELEETVGLLRKRGLSHLVRAAALKRMTVGEYLRRLQTELDLNPQGGGV